MAIISGKSNYGLLDYCAKQLGRPYWFGTSGQISTQTLYNTKKSQYPSYYSASDFKNQIGVKVHDCMGLIEGYIWSDDPDAPAKFASNGFPDYSADGFYKHCTRKGTDMNKMPDIPGLAVFIYDPAKGRYTHVGVYVGNGEVIEARGHAYGVVRTKFAGRGWTAWAYIDEIEYKSKANIEAEKKNLKPEKQYCVGLR